MSNSESRWNVCFNMWAKQAAENRLREVQTAKAEERTIHKNKNITMTLGSLRDWYLDLTEVKQRRSFLSIKNASGFVLKALEIFK